MEKTSVMDDLAEANFMTYIQIQKTEKRASLKLDLMIFGVHYSSTVLYEYHCRIKDPRGQNHQMRDM